MENQKIFISHSSDDQLLANDFVDFLTRAGISQDRIFCSSSPDMQISAGVPLYKSLRSALDNECVFVIFLLSKNFYASPFCLNEMGAVWMKKLEYQYFILPGFTFDQVQGVIKEDERICISLSQIDEPAKQHFFDLKRAIESALHLSIAENTWEFARDRFFKKIEEDYNRQGNSINMSDVFGCCIGDLDDDGCRIRKRESSSTKTTAVIDFSLTDTKLCSVVYPTTQQNWTHAFHSKESICFDIYSNNETFHAELELKLNGVNRTYDILVYEDTHTYRIPLNQFDTLVSRWSDVKEVCFLFRRKNIDCRTKVVIENLRLEN